MPRRRSLLWELPLGADPLSRFLKRRRLEEHSRQMLLQITAETGLDLPAASTVAAGDRRKLRGIPVVGAPGGLPGTIADTDPEREALRRLEQVERDRWRTRYEEPLKAEDDAADSES